MSKASLGDGVPEATPHAPDPVRAARARQSVATRRSCDPVPLQNPACAAQRVPTTRQEEVQMTTEYEIALAFGAIAALLMVISNLMKQMVALRLFALGANSLFIVQALLERNWIFCGLQTALLLINVYRLWTLRELLRSLERANADTSVKDWLLPQMKKKKFKAGSVVFTEGEPASELFYIQSGTIRSPQFKGTLGAGQLVGEVGMFSEDHTRAATVICETDCVFYTMTDEAAFLLYIQNPQIGFYLVRLIIGQLRGELQRRPAAPSLASE